MLEQKAFLSGNEAVAAAVRLARPHVIAAYPITPQTTVIERLAEMVEEQSLKAEYLHVESEHSALSACIGASAVGARTFTASSSQGLLYMAECLHYASGGRFPVVMMNANRSLALPWNIYGDQRDSLSLLDCGWIQAYAEDAQESFDLIIQAYAIAEHPDVLTPMMINLDGFVITHTYELVSLPAQQDVDAFLPPFQTTNKMDLDHPMSLGFTAGPAFNQSFKQLQHLAMMAAVTVIDEVEARFRQFFGRHYPGLLETMHCNDAEFILVTLGSVAGTVRPVIEKLRSLGERVGFVRIRYMRPFPDAEIRKALAGSKAVGVLEKDISFGFEGTVFTNVNSALMRTKVVPPRLRNFIGGLGGKDIAAADIEQIFERMKSTDDGESVEFI
ncbi:MAG: pyruvate ferredoxin oxidoreductase [Chlorobiaceae bacterium]|nr:pyruvate ferredoxin oxidoreductase [Chlorobiaceae bacterium]